MEKGLELVYEFKCAGAVPKNNGNFDTRRKVYDQASKTMLMLFFLQCNLLESPICTVITI